ncbi:MAG TPA: NADH-quinone oxidoreductase subunit M [Edaphocola sp.]|nr:NADH-quinone oxidoreductase subunit M [Edaphocola sp.]
MSLILLLLIPVIFGIVNFGVKNEKNTKVIALIGAITTLIIAVMAFSGLEEGGVLKVDYPWLPSIGASFNLEANGGALLMTLLMAITFVLIFFAQWNKNINNANRFFGLLNLSLAGLMGVFLANDLLLFYFFWELALIPVYFLAGQWGGKDKVKASFKFFVFTFFGSLLMLGGLIFLFVNNANSAFDYASIMQTGSLLAPEIQSTLFVLFFLAFGIKMPIFPLHSWQPLAYEQSATPVTIVMSALMVKMGLFAVLKWLIPLFPGVNPVFFNVIMILALFNIIYGSLLAMTQSNLKRLVAYSSLAHVGLMIMGAFAQNDYATEGLYLQMFNHGIIVTGLWLLVDFIENRYHTQDMKELGGMANIAPKAAITMVVLAFATIALPMTNGFVGEFLLFLGIFHSQFEYKVVYMIIAGLGIILGAIYMLNMVQKVAYGQKNDKKISDLVWNEQLSMYLIVIIIMVLGFYPNLILNIL